MERISRVGSSGTSWCRDVRDVRNVHDVHEVRDGASAGHLGLHAAPGLAQRLWQEFDDVVGSLSLVERVRKVGIDVNYEGGGFGAEIIATAAVSEVFFTL